MKNDVRRKFDDFFKFPNINNKNGRDFQSMIIFYFIKNNYKFLKCNFILSIPDLTFFKICIFIFFY